MYHGNNKVCKYCKGTCIIGHLYKTDIEDRTKNIVSDVNTREVKTNLRRADTSIQRTITLASHRRRDTCSQHITLLLHYIITIAKYTDNSRANIQVPWIPEPQDWNCRTMLKNNTYYYFLILFCGSNLEALVPRVISKVPNLEREGLTWLWVCRMIFTKFELKTVVRGLWAECLTYQLGGAFHFLKRRTKFYNNKWISKGFQWKQ